MQWEDADHSAFDNINQLVKLWQSEAIYYQPKNKSELINWNGVIYDYDTKKCFSIEQEKDSQKIKSSELKCDDSFLKKAHEPYLKIGDFQKYKSKFIRCLKAEDKVCLRQLISKTIMLSFGVDGYLDRRDLIFDSWKKEDFLRLKNLFSKGTTGDDYSKNVPPNPDNGGTGYRGEFKKIDGGWLLVSYLAGD